MTHGASDNDTNVDDEVICANNRDEHIDQDLHSDGMQGSMLSILPGVDALPTPDHVCAPDSNPAVEHGVSPANNDTNGGNGMCSLYDINYFSCAYHSLTFEMMLHCSLRSYGI